MCQTKALIPMKLSPLSGLVLSLMVGPMMIAADSIGSALTEGKASVNARLRYESAEQTGLKDSAALTMRTRLGYSTAPLQGWKAMVEAENVLAVNGDSYNQAGLNAAGVGRVVIADPETTEINQLWLSFSEEQTTATLGRQRLVLDNARFVGDVGWRQNQQTFDAVTLQDKSLPQTTLTYAYLWQINRVFGREHAQGRFDSNSSVLNASYAGFAAGTVTAYAYLLDFDNAATQSCATYGISFAGAKKINDATKLTYRAELATQSDYGSSPLAYRATYLSLEAGLAGKTGSLALGYEVMGSDGGVSFRTPLATLHAFDGWADLFLTTPGNGLRDSYLKTGINLPEGFNLLGFYHVFTADRLGADYGKEADLQVSRKFSTAVTGTVKYARFRHDLASLPDVTKFWLQLEYTY
jgi:hypothetical protein